MAAQMAFQVLGSRSRLSQHYPSWRSPLEASQERGLP